MNPPRPTAHELAKISLGLGYFVIGLVVLVTAVFLVLVIVRSSAR